MTETNELLQEGVNFQKAGDLDKAEACYKKVLATNPGDPNGLHLLGLIYYQRGEVEQADSYIIRAIEGAPGEATFHFNRGRILEYAGRLWESEAAYRITLQLDPSMTVAQNNRGNVLHRLGSLEEAEAAFRDVLWREPHYQSAHYNLGNVLREQGDLPSALKAFEAGGDIPQAWLARASLLLEMDRCEEALDLTGGKEELAQYPQFFRIRGRALTVLGRIEEAIEAFNQARDLAPNDVKTYFSLAAFAGHHALDVDLESLEEIYHDPDLGSEDRSFLCFGLGDFHAAEGSPHKAFRYWLEGNQLTRRPEGYQISAARQELWDWAQPFTRENLEALGESGHPSRRPVFVVGMPRSGTTLVEQILASHPGVVGLGEVGLVPNLLLQRIRDREGEVDPRRWDHLLTPEKCRELGQYYLEHVDPEEGGEYLLVNKTPTNFQYLGFIRAILPQARIIHCRRDPLDSGLSMFSKYFQGQLDFAFDLEDLGEYITSYQEVMKHWARNLPGQVFLELDYEELVADPETQVGRLLAHCGLEWDDACLAFSKTRRSVRTASSVQVRQPLYSTSVDRWQAYGENLLPLARSLGQTKRLGLGHKDFVGFSRLGRYQLKQGRLNEAAANLRRGLIWQSDKITDQAHLGGALEGLELFEEAASCYGEAAGNDPDSQLSRVRALRRAGKSANAERELEGLPEMLQRKADYWGELGWLRLAQNELERADTAFQEGLRQDPGHWPCLVGSARSLWLGGDFEGARLAYEDFLKRFPEDLETVLAVGHFYLEAHNPEQALFHAETARRLNPQSPKAFELQAKGHRARDDLDQADVAAQEACRLNPANKRLLGMVAAVQMDQGRSEAAQEAGREALQFDNQDPWLWIMWGNVRKQRADPWEALTAFRRAGELGGRPLQASLAEAEALETLNRFPEAEEALEKARESEPHHPRVVLLDARFRRRQGNYQEALEILRRFGEEGGALKAGHLAELGQLYDRLGEPQRAFSNAQQANERMRQSWRGRQSHKAPFLAKIQRLKETFTPEWIASWEAQVPEEGASAPVFLVGFPRSGTTLLENILRGHPQVEALEEKETVAPLWERLREEHRGDLTGLRLASPELLAELRDRYWQEVASYGADPGKDLVVDKLPLRLVEAGMIFRVFPDARFIFVRRHPCDCVLSGFFQLFNPNSAMANFYTLEDTARLYKAVMELWRQYRANLPLKVQEVRYEDLVEDFDGVIGGLLAFLELEWSEEVRDFPDRARQRLIQTPSASQVAQPVYREAMQRWMPYQANFEPLLPMLAPFAKEAGYSI